MYETENWVLRKAKQDTENSLEGTDMTMLRWMMAFNRSTTKTAVERRYTKTWGGEEVHRDRRSTRQAKVENKNATHRPKIGKTPKKKLRTKCLTLFNRMLSPTSAVRCLSSTMMSSVVILRCFPDTCTTANSRPIFPVIT